MSKVQGFGKGKFRHDSAKIIDGSVAYVQRVKMVELLLAQLHVATLWQPERPTLVAGGGGIPPQTRS